jgi:alkanesulfonate monooxygenase SsuD/methylene tetrahydromethanopterin reductase-like flavin-dependent oxidoreductase (luciferase family)
MNFGITLSNRGIPIGLCSARDLLALADAVEACPVRDSVWCGDALFVNRRLDASTLLAAVAGCTERVLLGPACMGSFALRNPLVFAYEWASLDVLSNGRTRLVVCAGGGPGPLWDAFGQFRRISALVGLHSQGRPRERPRHVGVRQRSLSPHQRERGQAGGARRFQEIPRPLLFSRLHQSAAASLADLWLAAGVRRAHQTVPGLGVPAHHLSHFDHGRSDGAIATIGRRRAPYVD